MIKVIAAMTKSRVIGNKGQLPWSSKDVPGELKWFAEATIGHTVVMGRTTWESFPQKFRPLPNRENIVLSRVPQGMNFQGAKVVASLEQALNPSNLTEDIWIIGGAQVYAQALPFTDELYLTILDTEFEGDTYFPEYENDFVFLEDIRQGDGWTVKKFIRK